VSTNSPRISWFDAEAALFYAVLKMTVPVVDDLFSEKVTNQLQK
jgi:hypothetical protein